MIDFPQADRQIMSRRRAEGALVVVTGASGGIGGGIMRRLLDDGWTVLAIDRTLPSAPSQNSQLQWRAVDLSQPEQIEALGKDLALQNAPIAGVVNAAGLLQDVHTLADTDHDAARTLWEVDYFACVSCTRLFAPMIAEGGGGGIVNLTSVNEHRPLPLHAYAPAKAALGAHTALAAGEYGPRLVRINAIAPGFTLTPILRQKIESGARNVDAILKATAMQRLVEIDEIADVAGFLMSDAASAITGASIPVDAGWMTSAHWMEFGAQLRN